MTAAFYLAAAHQSSGKTSVAVGLAACWAQSGLRVQVFKKGPDYIDPSWLAAASRHPCYVVDPYLEPMDEIVARFARYARAADVAFVEGNMGLHDGVSLEGEDSNAAVAAALRLPVVLVFDAKGMARTAAALLLGLAQFDSRLQVAGVILNRVATPRHEAKLRSAIERYCPFPVLGALPRLATPWTERHLGLVPAEELPEARERMVAELATWVAAHVDTAALLERVATISREGASPEAQMAGSVGIASEEQAAGSVGVFPTEQAVRAVTLLVGQTEATGSVHARGAPAGRAGGPLRLALARDAAFHFYYAEDLAYWSALGVELVPFDTLTDRRLPRCDALWLGGGFPESAAAALAENRSLRAEVAAACRDGLPVYAECGGLLYLGESLVTHDGSRYPMCGVLPGYAVMERKPVGRGYVHLAPLDHPWQAGGAIPAEVRAHEFHHARWHWHPEAVPRYVWRVVRGYGIDGAHDGACLYRVVAGFAHLRATVQWSWVAAFLHYLQEGVLPAGEAALPTLEEVV